MPRQLPPMCSTNDRSSTDFEDRKIKKDEKAIDLSSSAIRNEGFTVS